MVKPLIFLLFALLTGCATVQDGQCEAEGGCLTLSKAALIKSLSVNYVYLERHFAERDDGSGYVVQRDEAAFELFVSHEQLAKAVEPAVADLDHPAPRLPGRVAPLGLGLLGAINDVSNVAVRLDDLQGRPAAVSGIGAQVLAAPHAGRLAFDHDGLQHRIELRDVMLIGSGHDERQRDATTVHQQVALAPFFSPDRSDCVRPPLAPRAP